MPFAIVSVTNDLTTDQRVNRTCTTLMKSGYDVFLVGRRLKNSKTLAARPYPVHRMRLLFDKGPLFYAEYNLSLFFLLLSNRYDLLVSNDLDSLPANYCANAVKRFFSRGKKSRKLAHLHDCHEYFRGVPELVGRKTVTRIWKWIEDRIFPHLPHVVAVNQSVADIYHHEYGNRIEVVRNVPFRREVPAKRDKSILNIRPDQKIIFYQGAINVDRGLEEAIMAMKYLKTDAVLVIAGIGDRFDALQNMTSEQGLQNKVIFLGQIPFQKLHDYTCNADIGLSIEKDVGINYHYCLPNKFLDYIQANIPVLVSPFPEMKTIVDQYHIGEYIKNHDPSDLAIHLDQLLNDDQKIVGFKQNLLKAAADLCWENEETVLLRMLQNIKER
jgi:glycosyltransferase involved in cell wall biosynthesis